MKKHIIRVSILCLALTMVLPTLFGCNFFGKDKPEETDTQSDIVLDIGSGTNEDGEVDERTKYLPERINYDGVDFVIAHSLTDNNRPFITYVDSDNLKSDAVNKAFFERNKLLESYFNVKMVVNQYKNSGNVDDVLLNELQINSLSSEVFADATYSIACGVMNGMISNGYVMDLNAMDGLNLEASYYDQRIQEEYNIEGKLFTIEGDFTVQDEMRTMVVGINKTIYNEYHYNDTYGDPYKLVDNGKWTLDLMLQMAKATGDTGTLTKDSQWGIISESQFPYTVYLGTGNKIVKVNDGSLICTLADPSSNNVTVNILSDCVDKILKSPDVSILIADKSPIINGFPEAQAMFANGQALFRTSTLYDFTKYQSMEDEFGILPVPKYSEDQLEYYSWCSSTSHCPLMVPKNAKHADRTANIIEAMAYFSKYMPGSTQSLLDAFYENLMNAKLCKTVEDREMLELVFAHKTFDIDYALNLSATGWKITSIAGTTDYSIPSIMQTYTDKMTSTDENNPMTKFISSMWEKCPNS